MVKTLGLCAILMLVLQGCATYKPLSEPKSVKQLVDFHTNWRRGVDGGFGESSERFNMVLEESGLYFITNRGVIYQINPDTGRRIISFKFEDVEHNISTGVQKHGDFLYFSTYDAELIAVSFTTKKEIWRHSLTSEVLSEPVVAGNKLAVQTSDGWLSLLDANTGNILWRVKEDIPVLTLRGTSSPIIADGKVIAGFSGGQVKAFSLFNGKAAWSFAVGKPEGKYEIERLSDVDGRLLLLGNTLFSTAYNGTVSAIDVQSGRALWQRNISSVLSTALLDDLLIVVDQTSKVFALNAKNGNIVWESTQLTGRDLISPVAFHDYVAVMDRSGYVHLLSKETGKIVAYTLADKVLPSGSRMVPKGKQLFILTRNEQLTALTL